MFIQPPAKRFFLKGFDRETFAARFPSFGGGQLNDNRICGNKEYSCELPFSLGYQN
jgi:hypothetical protein